MVTSMSLDSWRCLCYCHVYEQLLDAYDSNTAPFMDGESSIVNAKMLIASSHYTPAVHSAAEQGSSIVIACMAPPAHAYCLFCLRLSMTAVFGVRYTVLP